MSIVKCLRDFEVLYMNGNYRKAVSLLCKYNDCELCAEHFVAKCNVQEFDDVASECLFFVDLIIQNNIAVSKILINMIEKPGEDFKNLTYFSGFYTELQKVQSASSSVQHLSIELVILYNYLVCRLGYHFLTVNEWTDEAWTVIRTALERACYASNNVKLNLWQQSDEKFLLQNINVRNISSLSSTLVCYICCILTVFAMMEKKYSLLFSFLKVITVTGHKISTTVLHESFVPSLKILYPWNSFNCAFPSLNDFQKLLMACYEINENKMEQALILLNDVIFHGWRHFVWYLKAFLYYSLNKFNSAMETAMKFWKEKNTSEKWLIANFSNLIGCCKFQMHKYKESLSWFYLALSMSDKSLFSVWNISRVLIHQNSLAKATDVLTKKISSYNMIDCFKDYTFCQTLLLKPVTEMNSLEAHYLLAHHYGLMNCYSEAFNIFSKLLGMLKLQGVEVLPKLNGTGIFLHEIYTEAAYIFLHSKKYQECLNACKYVDLLIPISEVSFHDSNLSFRNSKYNGNPFSYDKDNLQAHEFQNKSYATERIDDDVNIPLKKSRLIESEGNKVSNISNLSQLKSKFSNLVIHLVKSLMLYDQNKIFEATKVMDRAYEYCLELLEENNCSLSHQCHLENFGFTKEELALNNVSSRELYTDHSSKILAPENKLSNESYVTMEKIILEDCILSPVSANNFNANSISKGTVSSQLPQNTDCNTVSEDFDAALFQDENDIPLVSHKSMIFHDENNGAFSGNNAKSQCCRTVSSQKLASKYLEGNSLIAEIFNNLSIVYLSQARLNDAYRLLNMALKVNPDNVDVIYNFCLLEIKLGNFEKAQQFWMKAKQKVLALSNILANNSETFLYNVTVKQLETLNSVLSESEMLMEFDISWD